MSEQGLSDSRFYMWRAVFAMAHVDGTISAEEAEFADGYLERAPFSDAQKETLRDDMRVAKKVADMLALVSEPSDQADFFQFSQMLAWADGDYSAQEKALVDRMTHAQVERVNQGDIAQNIRDARKAAILRRALEDDEFEAQARDVSGFINVVRNVVPWAIAGAFEAPDAEMFKLWQAVFSLVHVDGEVAEEERSYIEGMMDVFYFSDKQRAVIEDNMKTPGDVVGYFKKISSTRHRKQFFIMARTIVWCDGIFHDDERAALDAVKDSLRDALDEYANEVRFLDRKPAAPQGEEGESDEERMMKSVVKQMVEFYQSA